jgi:transcriptional regulator GlxA family with amidase domain
MRRPEEPVRFGIVVYPGVEPIDIGGTIGVISMARRILPGITSIAIAERPGVVRLAGGLAILVSTGFDACPACDAFIVCGGPGWEHEAENPIMRRFLGALPDGMVASVCTGAGILAAAGILDGRCATSRRRSVGAESQSPLSRLAEFSPSTTPREAAIVDDKGVVTAGGVSLAIDGTLYLIGQLYGADACENVARLIEYDRAWAANRAALGHYIVESDLARANAIDKSKGHS